MNKRMSERRHAEVLSVLMGERPKDKPARGVDLSIGDPEGRSMKAMEKFWANAPSDTKRREFEDLILRSDAESITIQAGFEAAVSAMRSKTY